MGKLGRAEGADRLRDADQPRGLRGRRQADGARPGAAGLRHAGADDPKFIRPRTLVYAGVLGLVVAIMGGSWLLRQTTSLSVLRDRAPNFVRLSDGGVRNAYALKLGDKTRDVGKLRAGAGRPGRAATRGAGRHAGCRGRPVLTTRPDGISQWRALVTAPPGLKLPENVPLKFKLLDAGGRTEVAHRQRLPGTEAMSTTIEPRRSAWIPWVFVGGMALVVAVNGGADLRRRRHFYGRHHRPRL